MEKVRINKYIASSGLTSRRGADELIKQGKVKVNGNIIIEPGMLVCDRDKIIIDGKRVGSGRKEYYIFHKPAGFITTKEDPNGRKTIYDILPERLKNLNPAGRLDKASSGLIILTNDGELIQELTHPKIQVSKNYKVTVEGRITEKELATLEGGIELEPGKIAYADVTIVGYEKNCSYLQVILYQGYNRQIRRMMDHINHPVIKLKRTTHGTISIEGLERGDYRKLSPSELKNLRIYLNKKLNALKKKEK